MQAYVPKLQTVGWVCQFLRWQRHYEIPSSAAFGKIGDAYVAEVYRWAKAHGIPVRRFAKGVPRGSTAGATWRTKFTCAPWGAHRAGLI